MDFSSKVGRVHEYIDRVFPTHVEQVQQFLRCQSVSLQEEGLLAAAVWLQEHLSSLGGEATLVKGEYAPIVFARLGHDKPKTLLVYGMYDVQGVEGQTWTSPPFAAEVHDLPGIGASIVARGACNSKAPLAGLLNALDAISKVDEIPVNLVFAIEGEEELGSPSLPGFYRDHAGMLQADAGFEPFWACYGTDVSQPILSLGTKGILGIELACRGGEWGGPTKQSIHGSVGAWLSSPAWRLIRAISTLVDDQEEVAVSTLVDDTAAPSPADEYLLNRLGARLDEQATLDLMGAKRFKYPLHGSDLLRKYLFDSTIQVDSLDLSDGDTVPAEVRAKLTIRLAPGIEPEDTVDKLREHLASYGLGDIEVTHRFGYPGSRTGLHEGVVQAMLKSYRYHGYEPAIWPLLASATPYYLFSKLLGIPYVCGGLGNAARSHVADEYATLEGLRLLEKSLVTFLYEFAAG